MGGREQRECHRTVLSHVVAGGCGENVTLFIEALAGIHGEGRIDFCEKNLGLRRWVEKEEEQSVEKERRGLKKSCVNK